MVLEIPFLEPKNEQGSVVVDEAARKLYNEVLPSVVEIQARTNAGRGIGSGFFIDQERVVTNQHVVAGKIASISYMVALATRRELSDSTT